MMELILKIFGEGTDLTTLQMCARGFVIFCTALVLLRVSGRRSFGLKTPLDLIISILLGSVLSRAVVGASPFFPVLFCSLLIVVLHRIFGWFAIHNKNFRRLTEGHKILVYKDGSFLKENMNSVLIDEEDIREKVRKQTFQNHLNNVECIYMERNGDLSVVKRESQFS